MIGCRLTAAAVFAIAVTGGIAVAQGQGERVFAFRSGAGGNCPLLDWLLVVEPDHGVNGMIGWNNDTMIARLIGTLDLEAKTFSLTAKEAGGKRTATIDGKVTSPNHLVVNIKAPLGNCQNVDVWAFKRQDAGE